MSRNENVLFKEKSAFLRNPHVPSKLVLYLEKFPSYTPRVQMRIYCNLLHFASMIPWTASSNSCVQKQPTKMYS